MKKILFLLLMLLLGSTLFAGNGQARRPEDRERVRTVLFVSVGMLFVLFLGTMIWRVVMSEKNSKIRKRMNDILSKPDFDLVEALDYVTLSMFRGNRLYVFEVDQQLFDQLLENKTEYPILEEKLIFRYRYYLLRSPYVFAFSSSHAQMYPGCIRIKKVTNLINYHQE